MVIIREILFKAKTAMIVGTYNCGKDDGEWVIGHLYCDVGKWIIRQFEFDRADYVSYEVDPETVCQYIGLTDKNGKKIWENDIVETVYDGKLNPNYVVVWDEYELDFKATNGKKHYKTNFEYLGCCEEIVVIGNIFDNPVLLKSSR